MANKEISDIQIIKEERAQKQKFVNKVRTKFNSKLFKRLDIVFARYNRKRLVNDNFTIISNNCWGGTIYERYGLMKNTPTVGLYFFASDYIRFVNNLEYYLSQELKFIEIEKSKYRDVLIEKKQDNEPIGMLDDIEIVFLHYKSPEEALLKWKRRVKRINWDNIIVKFSESNLCTYDDLIAFNKIPYEKKIVFVKQEYPDIENSIVLGCYKNCVSVLEDTYDCRWKYLRINQICKFEK